MASKLIAEQGNLKGLILSFDEGNEWIAGRDPDLSQLIIEDPEVSRKHLHLKSTAEGIMVENLSETNPALVNGEQLTAPRLLHEGDIITLGKGTYRFDAENDLNGMNKQEEPLEDQMEPRQDSIFDENSPAGKDALAEINFELVDTGRWLLKVIGGPNNGAEYAMQASNNYVIGTDPNSCDIVFHDTSVSRQHAKITVTDEDTLFIEDLKSRNGTLLDGEPLKTKKQLNPNTLISMGTTSFIVYDREGEMQTIISPLLPSIVKVLQKEEPRKTEEQETLSKKTDQNAPQTPFVLPDKEKPAHNIGGLVVITIVTAIAAIIGIGVTTLFKSEPVVVSEQVDFDKALSDVMAPFPSIKWSFNKTTGRLFLVGHLLTSGDRNQLLYNLQGLKFIKDKDDSGVIIDEYVWQDINQLLANNPNWRGITVQSPSPGHFILIGYLQTRKQAEQLSQYMSENFRYLDLLENKIVVDEDVITQVTSHLQTLGLKNLAVQMSNGELTLSGKVPSNKTADFNHTLDTLKNIPGVRVVKNYVTEMTPEASLVNISDKYTVTGYSRAGAHLTVVISGRILSKGDQIDGMTIIDIKPNAILLEKDNVKYQIDYSK